MRTTAAISTGPNSSFELHEIEISDPRSDEILIRLVATGICHTDLGVKAVSTPGVAAVYGHEGAGVVERIGSEITGVRVGDHVVIGFDSCGRCPRCAAGNQAYCQEFGLRNASGMRLDGTSPLTTLDGTEVWASFFGQSSFARHAIARRTNVIVVPPDVDLTMVAPLGCGFQTGAGAVVNIVDPEPSSSLAVFGTGGVGIAAVMAASALGVETIIAVDLHAERRQLALDVGATHAFNGSDPDLSEKVRALTKERPTAAIDTTAVPQVIRTAAHVLGPLGTLVLVGIGQPEVSFDVSDIIMSGKTIRGCIEGDADPAILIPRLLAWYAEGKFPLEKVVTTYAFETINEAVRAATGATVKPILIF
ncbi:NAD(P)-dependent alcohol dehydrogenase [Rhodococcus sp. WS3]|uniref:NAD(P)-dependent alcohol dehydrogenase n=1 Tax=Rhodococcus sp. WS3 TaxID=2486271 RepID=UPI001142BEAD|nr:NAD(P)-dependent alcohol dehydrogenase [Rhodococcus sp. WS3]ROZ48976.1 NAD(P)-dependent alcohol dehydrogenase [Rhodococcus sp. WS3]